MFDKVLAGAVAFPILFAPIAGAAPGEDINSRPFVDAAAAMAVLLTSVSYQTVDSDVQRILDSSTNPFHDDFARRSDEFERVVRNAGSTSTGTVVGTALDSLSGDSADVDVALTVHTVYAAVPPADRDWRLRIHVNRIGDTYKAASVQFVSPAAGAAV